jgi:hypothetical protein
LLPEMAMSVLAISAAEGFRKEQKVVVLVLV